MSVSPPPVPEPRRLLPPGSALLLRSLAARRGETLRVLSLVLVAGAAEAAALALLVPLLSLAGIGAGGTLEPLDRAARAVFAAAGVPATLPGVLGSYVVLATVLALVVRARDVGAGVLQVRIMADLRKRLYAGLSEMEWIAFARIPAARITHGITEEVGNAGEAVEVLLGLIAGGVLLAVHLGLCLSVAPGMTAAVLVLGILLFAVAVPWVRRTRRRGEDGRFAVEEFYGSILDHLAGSKTARGQGQEEQGRRRLFGAADRMADGAEGILRALADLRVGLTVASVVLLALFVHLALGVAGMEAGALLLALYLLRRVIPGLVDLVRSRQYLASLEPSLDALARLQGEAEAAARPADPRAGRFTLREGVRLEEVRFSYGGPRSDRVLRGLDLVLPAGRTTALVGPTASGKTTVADLVLGILSPDGGRVLVDGVALTPRNRASWGSAVGYVSQEPFLFGESVRANLLWARPDADEAEMWRALEQADAATVASRLPGGLDAPIGDRGSLLSGGERQRIALACALLRRPDLLVLDEATSALDPESELRVRAAVDGLRGGTTILQVTHRLGSVRGADRIHVLEHGRISESGTWDELMANPRSRFRALALAQGYARLVLREDGAPSEALPAPAAASPSRPPASPRAAAEAAAGARWLPRPEGA